MSSTIQKDGTAAGWFQVHFGVLPGSDDAKTECGNWERLCGDLLAEREKLRAELERARLDEFRKGFVPTLTMEQVYAQVDRETSLEQVIADLKEELEVEQ